MADQDDPFGVLGVSAAAEIEVIQAAYKALARKYHPDSNPGVPPADLTARMARVNWAKEQLDHDLAGWRACFRPQRPERPIWPTGRSATSVPTQPQAPTAVQISPPVVFLQGRKGSIGEFVVRAAGLPSSRVKATLKGNHFYREGRDLAIRRHTDSPDSVRFAVLVNQDFGIADKCVFEVEILVPGFQSANALISVAPISR